MNERTYIDPRCTREGWPSHEWDGEWWVRYAEDNDGYEETPKFATREEAIDAFIAAHCDMTNAPYPATRAADQPSAFPPREHAASADCWCNPRVEYVDPETGVAVYVHHKPN